MAKPKTSAQRQKEIAALKKKKEALRQLKKVIDAKRKEEAEIRELKRQINAGNVGRQTAKRLGKTAANTSWKTLKAVGGVVKRRLEEEAREQARDAARERAKRKKKKR